MIKYLGSKRLLVPRIVSVVTALGGGRVMDVFSGTSRVGMALKAQGMQVIANDQLSYAATLARCYVQADADEVRDEVTRLLAELRQVPPKAGYFTYTFCEKARFFHPKNGARVDAIRDRIARLGLSPDVEAVCLVSLMEAADRVDSTTGVQMAYLKQWATRANNDLELRMPEILPGRGEALQLDAIDAVRAREVDVAYMDPPYNQHRYLGNYHIWETLVRWDAPETYGVAQKRIDCRERHTPFNSRKQIHDALALLVREATAMARLAHPNVIHVYEVGENEGRVFLAMEFVRGPNLRGWLKEAERGWPEVVAMFVQAGRGLSAAHQAGLVHCDFKPENVLVGQDGRVRVLDFGLARHAGAQVEATPARVAGLSAYLVTVADHGMNASTFTARVVTSTGSDSVSAVVAAIA